MAHKFGAEEAETVLSEIVIQVRYKLGLIWQHHTGNYMLLQYCLFDSVNRFAEPPWQRKKKQERVWVLSVDV